MKPDTTATHAPIALTAELLDGPAFDLAAFAQACGQPHTWVHQRVAEGVIETAGGEAIGQWRFTTTTVRRARRIAHLERTFDADPHLAALTADLMEEVERLRRNLSAADLMGPTHVLFDEALPASHLR